MKKERYKKAGLDYRDLQQIEALRDAAVNEGGAAGAGVGIGAGIGLGQQLSQSMAAPSTPETTKASSTDDDIMGSLLKLKQLFEMAVISEQEYADKKKEILSRL